VRTATGYCTCGKLAWVGAGVKVSQKRELFRTGDTVTLSILALQSMAVVVGHDATLMSASTDMTLGNAFFFIAGAISMVALLVVIYPWLAGRSRAELRAALPRWVPWAGGGALALVLAVYVTLGAPQLLSHDSTPVAAAGSATSSKTAASMDSAVQGLERRLAAGGGSDGDWELLAKSYEFLGRADDAALARQKQLPPGTGAETAAPAMAAPARAAAALSPQAMQLLAAANAARTKRNFAAARDQYEKLAARGEMNADAWADFADVTATLNGRSLQGRPAEYLAKALRLDPQHPKALWLEASLQHESGQYQAATQSWQRLATALGPDSPDSKVVAANLAEDQRLAGGAANPGAGAASTNSGTVQGEVVVANALKGKIPAGLTLFIVAKSVNSPGPPVAIWRTATTGNWPIEFKLDDSQAMMPMRKLSTAGAVTIEARTSRTGQAMPAPGDFQGVSAQLVPGSNARIRVVMEKVIG
jgi:cytochrome c-type biogenesis protein CcmH/NrfG